MTHDESCKQCGGGVNLKNLLDCTCVRKQESSYLNGFSTRNKCIYHHYDIIDSVFDKNVKQSCTPSNLRSTFKIPDVKNDSRAIDQVFSSLHGLSPYLDTCSSHQVNEAWDSRTDELLSRSNTNENGLLLSHCKSRDDRLQHDAQADQRADSTTTINHSFALDNVFTRHEKLPGNRFLKWPNRFSLPNQPDFFQLFDTVVSENEHNEITLESHRVDREPTFEDHTFSTKVPKCM